MSHPELNQPSVTTSRPEYHNRKEIGTTVADALRLLKKAKRVAVAVPTGFGNEWHYFTASKADAKRYLKHRSNPAYALYSHLTHFSVDDSTLHIGNPHDMSRAVATAKGDA